MKKGFKIFLIAFGFIFIIVSTLGSTLYYSYRKAEYAVGDTTVAFDIQFDIVDEYVGFIVTTTPVEFVNNGLYDIKNVNITISVYGADFSLESLNGQLLSKGTNLIGDIERKTLWSGDLITNITYYIALLAVQDGNFQIIIDLSFKIDFLVFDYPYSTQFLQTKQWNSPFGI